MVLGRVSGSCASSRTGLGTPWCTAHPRGTQSRCLGTDATTRSCAVRHLSIVGGDREPPAEIVAPTQFVIRRSTGRARGGPLRTGQPA